MRSEGGIQRRGGRREEDKVYCMSCWYIEIRRVASAGQMVRGASMLRKLQASS